MVTTPDDRHIPAPVIDRVAAAAASDSGLDSTDLLGDFLHVLGVGAADGRPLDARILRDYRAFGDAAARRGVALRALLDLYLSAAWRLWSELPAVARADANPRAVVAAGDVMLRAVDGVVAELTEGFQLARRTVVRA
ncbi:MAG: PucR family transcriptional regulator, partial [Rhodococcus sp. (in: high G+C Gram-positive bacteria)]